MTADKSERWGRSIILWGFMIGVYLIFSPQTFWERVAAFFLSMVVGVLMVACSMAYDREREAKKAKEAKTP